MGNFEEDLGHQNAHEWNVTYDSLIRQRNR